MLKQELTTSKQIVEEEQRTKRECKGRRLAISRNVYRLLNTDVYYVESESSDNIYYFVKFKLESESSDNIYYFVKFKPDVIEFCSCMDSSTRNVRCKHSFAVEFAIRLGTLKDTDKLPADAKRESKSYTDDDGYDFNYEKESIRTLNELEKAETETPTKSYTEDQYDF